MLQDEEDGDMYEAPPCERSLNSGPPRQVMENEYMGKGEASYDKCIYSLS